MRSEMGLRFKILGSSSSGNCALLCTDACKVLIDAGFSGRKISQMLAENGESIDEIDAVFLTHEHGDHTAGLSGLSRKSRIEFFANRDTAQAAQSKLKRPIAWKIFENGRSFRFKDIEVSPFSIPHDAYDPVGFVISAGDGSLFSPHRSLAWVTDLGYVPNLVRERIRDVDVLVVEANYDVKMLEADEKRPWSVKQRISGRHGHLSNDATFELLAEADKPRWQQVYLAHLSRDCNCMETVKRKFESLRTGSRKFKLDVVDPLNGGPAAFDFSSISF